ncbi:MAG: TadE/TadG family type IV pilus assembly protein [Bellilinea sp.]
MKSKLVDSKEKAQSLVELALMLFLILIMLAGVVDLGRMMYEYLSMRDGAQEGAGYGAIYPNYCDEIETRVWDNLPADFSTPDDDVYVTVNGLDCAAASVADQALLLPANGCMGKEIIVNIDHQYEMSMPFFAGKIVNMHVEIKDRIVRPNCN